TNDVRAATYGEWQHGSGKGVDDMVVIFVGTGIGGGVVSGGRILEGCYNTGGELGHTMLVSGGRKCRCPNRGCLEAYSGGWAIAERAKEAVSENPAQGETLKTLGGGTKNITAATVSQAYGEGDILAKRLVEETGKYLASGVVGIVNAFSPCLLAFGGGVIEGLPVLINAVEKTIRKRALTPGSEKLKVVKGELGVKAGVIGASEMARNRFGGGAA
ncbi:MAG: ROK family protein, partial [Candidatus Hydrothermarchaeaceae archaeon]